MACPAPMYTKLKKMKTYLIPMFAALVMISCGENNKPEDSAEVAEDKNEAKFENDNYEKDAEFAVKAAVAGYFEIKTAELVISRTSNTKVKELAQMMKTDHSAANTELKGLAAQNNFSVPDTMDAEHSKKYYKLMEKTGNDFDKEYCDLMVSGHKDVIDFFEKESIDGKEQNTKSWAAAKLPTLRHHLEMAESTKELVK